MKTQIRALAPAIALALVLPVARPARAITVPTNFVVENAVTSGTFNTPVGMAYLPDGRMFVLEKRGRVYLVTNGVKAATAVVSLENEVLDDHDRGALGIAVDPNFTSNRLFYLLYTVDPDLDGNDTAPQEAFGRLTRYRLGTNDLAESGSRTILIGDTWTNGLPIGSDSHSIGSLRFGQDGSLLVSCGDGGLFTEMDPGGQYPGLFGSGKTDPFEDIGAFRAQSLSSLAGKILRINPADGSGYSSNPFWDGNAFSKRSRIWCYGLRNPFRFTVRPNTGNSNPTAGDPGSLYIGDVGWTVWEEADVTATGGKNFGWPCYEGRLTNSEYQSASPAHNGCGSVGTSDNPVSPTLPPLAWHHSSASAAFSTPPGYYGNCSVGGAFYTSNQYPSTYQGRYFFADYGQNWIRMATYDANETFVSMSSFAADAEGPVDFTVEPVTGNLMYVSITAQQVRRIRYTGAGGGNSAPIATASATPENGQPPLNVQFSSSGSFDPDSDPITFAWDFGDGTGSASANPSHTYSAGGSYPAVLTVSDNRGGIGRDTVYIAAAVAGSFPTTPVLDNFNRADGTLTGSWVGGYSGLVISANQLAQTSGSASPIWNGTVFGATQEAYVTLGAITPGGTEHDLMLKVQGQVFYDGHIEVRYDADPHTVSVSTYTTTQGWVLRGGPFPVTFNNGDRFGARAYPNGSVEVYKNSTLVGTANTTGWPFYANGGRIGMTIADAVASRFDNFGGGNTVLTGPTNTPPNASIVAPPDNTFYIDGVSIAMQGSASDTQDPTPSLTLNWQFDLIHNNHTHPNSILFSGANGTFVGENHDDGTGVHYLARFIATDLGGLKDTASINLWPEIDLSPSPLTITPAALTTSTSPVVSFRLRNMGRMPANISRWQLRLDATSAAFGDTVVPARDSVTITRTLPPLSLGNHVLRAVADTLNQCRETLETNNGVARSVTVTGAPDTQAPTILTGPTVTPGSTTATVAWTTNEAASGAVRYGLTAALGDSATVGSATSQSRSLTGLTRGTLYFFQVAATDAAGNTRLSAIASFTTLPNRAPVAVASGTPSSGAAPLTVQFSSAGSSDPDGDALTYAWAFGDGSNGTGAGPSHAYAAVNGYAAILTVTDGFGGSDTASVAISVTTVPTGFPVTGVLDNFNRANGALGSGWTGQTAGMGINANRMVQTTSGYNTVYWNGGTFGPDQEAYVRLSAITANSREHDVLLKCQGVALPAAHIEVRYDSPVKRVYVSTWQSGAGWRTHATISQTLVAGDILGARAFANGTVDVYRNATKIGTASVTAWTYYAQGGGVGISIEKATASALDDFGGGNVVSGPDLTPPNFVTGPTATPNGTNAVVQWTTNEPATGKVAFGLTTALGTTATSPLGTTHAVTLTPLSRGTLYYFQVTATDASTNTRVASVQSFTTLANRAPVAVASGTPSSGAPPLTVQFSSAGSNDPDGDPVSYAWTFGDGGTGSGATVSHAYAGIGNYTAVLTASDGFGGSNTASVPIVVATAPTGFPATAVLDNFNRADGAVGGSWVAGTTGGLGIITQQLGPTGVGYASPVFNTVFGANQEAYVTFRTITATASEHDLMLKVQGQTWDAGHLEVRYDPAQRAIYVSTYAPTQGWRQYGTISIQLVAGDVLGARAFSNGTVEVYRNGVRLNTFSYTAWPFYALGGRLGMTVGEAASARFDDFGGGTVTGTAALAPPVPAMSSTIGGRPGLELSTPYPNPVTDRMQLVLVLPSGGLVEWDVVDLAGRAVWHDRLDLPAGASILSWQRGAQARPGVYMVRVRTPQETLTRRFALIR